MKNSFAIYFGKEKLRKLRRFAIILVTLSFGMRMGFCQTSVVGDPVGLLSISLPNSSDTIVSPPFTRPPAYLGQVASVTNYTITVSPSPGWSTNTFASAPYYVQALSGNQAGIIFDVLSNNSSSITVATNWLAPTGFAPGVLFKVVPYWTLGSLFPSSNQGISFMGSGAVGTRYTQILFPDTTNYGINRAASATYYFVTNSTWRQVGSGTNDMSTIPLPPDSYVIVRNATNALSGLKLLSAGWVHPGAMAVQLDGNTNANDNYISLSRPVNLQLANLGLITSGAFQVTTNALNKKDQLLTFDNTTIGFNKASSATYYYLSSGTNVGWRQVGSTADAGTNVIPAAMGFVIRKAATNAPATQFFTNTLSISQ
jgi:uncharacterized protein (TIGR02597 family)